MAHLLHDAKNCIVADIISVTGRKLAELELRVLTSLLVLSFRFEPLPAALSSYRARDVVSHMPWQAYVKICKLD